MTHEHQADRAAGILCHVSSLPGRFGQGTFGTEARDLIESLARSGFRIWQILPLNPPDEEGSPYKSASSRAMNPAFIDFDEFVALGFDSVADVEGRPEFLDFDAVNRHRRSVLPRLVDWIWADPAADALRDEAEAFFVEQGWLNDFVLFQLIHAHVAPTVPWWEWPEALRHRDPEALAAVLDDHEDEALQLATEQFLLFHQWRALAAHAASRGVKIMGDLPIYVAANSADTWANPALFQLSEDGTPGRVAGVPPDYFAENGQLWGNPLYDWDAMADRGFDWWADRMHQAAELFDIVRIDHFRAFSRYWAIPAEAESAVSGEWVDGPGTAVFGPIFTASDALEIVAEDLGDIDEGVVQLRDGLGLPGMRVVQFAFNEDTLNPHRFDNHAENSVCYLGTHDNQPTVGWLAEMDADRKAYVAGKLGMDAGADDQELNAAMITATLGSESRYALISAQDILGLGAEATMNRPGESEGNWRWRLAEMGSLDQALRRLRDALHKTGRL